MKQKIPWPSLNPSFTEQANDNEIPLLHESNGTASEGGTSLEVSLPFPEVLITIYPLSTSENSKNLEFAHCLFKL